jgi:hypothetical protein
VAEISKSGTPSLASVLPPQSSQIAGLRAGGAAATTAANVHGWAAEAANSGEAVTLYHGVHLRYGAGLTPGASYFLSGTVAGGVADAASTGGTAPCAFAVDATRIRVLQSVLR